MANDYKISCTPDQRKSPRIRKSDPQRRIILPAGTSLPVFLNLTVPVDTSIPVNLQVAVDIPLNETQLREPFAGLQDVVKPLYCLVKTNAKNGKGEAVCK